MKITTTRRLGAALLAPALAAGMLLAAPSAQAANSRSNAGAVWIADQLTHGLFHYDDFGGYDEYGLSIDALLAFEAIGGYADEIDRIADGVADNIQNYIGFGDQENYAGATAKALVAAEVADKTPTSFGGVNLVTDLEALVSTEPATAGRIADVSAYGDYANVFGQAFAAQGLNAVDSAKAPAATEFLLQQQCADGSFRLNFSAPDAAEQGCTTGVGSEPDTDATALAIRALLPQQATPAVATAIDKAAAWLIAEQEADGSFGGGVSTEAPNANSTGTAALSLSRVGEEAAAAKAAGWLAPLQATNLSACGTKLAVDHGAIAYDQVTFDAARTAGITAGTLDKWRRSTPAAAAALSFHQAPEPLPAATLGAVAPTGFVQGASSVTVQVSGLAAGEAYCVTGATAAGGKADGAGKATVSVKAPAATGNVSVKVTGSRASRTGSATLKVLGAKALAPKLRYTSVKAGKSQNVTVTGLAPSEPLTIKYSNVATKTAKANASGTYSYTFKVGSKKGKKTVKVTGAFSNRTGSKTFTVR